MTGPYWHGDYHVIKDAYKVSKCPCGVYDGSMNLISEGGRQMRECPHCSRRCDSENGSWYIPKGG